MRPAAVLLGFATDLTLTLFFSTVVVAIVGGDTPQEASERMRSSAGLMVSLTLVGLAFTGVGGYVAAAMARERHVEHGAAVGALALGLGLACAAGVPDTADAQPLWLQAAGFILTVPLAAFGGWYRKFSEVQK